MIKLGIQNHNPLSSAYRTKEVNCLIEADRVNKLIYLLIPSAYLEEIGLQAQLNNGEFVTAVSYYSGRYIICEMVEQGIGECEESTIRLPEYMLDDLLRREALSQGVSSARLDDGIELSCTRRSLNKLFTT